MKIPKSATQAAAPLSSSSSSAIGFEAPFQYAVTSADAVQMCKFPSIANPYKMLDTDDKKDDEAIRSEVSKMGLTDATLLYHKLTAESQNERSQLWAQSIANYFQGRVTGEVWGPQPEHLLPIVDAGEFSGGVVSKGEIYFSGGARLATDPVDNQSSIDQSQSPFFRPNRQSPEHQVSRNDSEVQMLTELWNLFNNATMNSLDGQSLVHPLLNSSEVQFGLYMNVGPCDGCKDRIDLFWNNVLDLVTGMRLPHTVTIFMRIYYSHEEKNVNRKGNQTQYGYFGQCADSATAIQIPAPTSDDKKAVRPAFKTAWVAVVEAQPQANATIATTSVQSANSSSSSSATHATGATATTAAAVASSSSTASSAASSTASSAKGHDSKDG